MIQPKPEILATPSAHHGAFDYDELAQLGYSPDDVIDFSVNSNPYGPPQSVHEAIARVSLDRYPDRECLALRKKLADHHQVHIDNIVVGNGTAEILLLIAMAFINQGDKVVTFAHTFSEYERVSRLMGGEIYRLQPSITIANFANYPKYRETVNHAKVVFECLPNNPTGDFAGKMTLQSEFQEKHPNTLFVYDVAYINFIEEDMHQHYQPPKLTSNMLTVHSLTKDFALAGLRLGYAIGHPDIIEAIRLVRPAWNVNALAQVAGLAVLDDISWLRDTVNQLHEDKQNLIHGLQALGLRPLPSAVHYFLVKVGNAREFRSKLLQHKIMVRDCTSFGLPDYIRISTRKPDDNQRLLDAIRAVMKA